MSGSGRRLLSAEKVGLGLIGLALLAGPFITIPISRVPWLIAVYLTLVGMAGILRMLSIVSQSCLGLAIFPFVFFAYPVAMPICGVVVLGADLVLLVAGVPSRVWAFVVNELSGLRDKGRVRFLCNVAENEFREGRTDRCLALIERALNEVHPKFEEETVGRCLALKGQALVETGLPLEAVQVFAEARRLGPMQPESLAVMAHLLAERERADVSDVEVYLEHIQSSPSVPDPLVSKQIDALCLSVPEGALTPEILELNKRVASLLPDHAASRYVIGRHLFEQDDMEAALTHLRIAAPVIPHADYLCRAAEGRQFEKKGDMPRALQVYRAATAEQALHLEAWFLLTRALVEACEAEGADVQSKQWAEEAARGGDRLCDNPVDVPVHLLFAGRAYLLTSRSDDAVKALRRAVASKPSDVGGNWWLAEALLRAGDHAGSAIFARSAISLDETRADSWHLLGRAHGSGRSHDEARQAFAEALRLAPSSAAIRRSLGRLLFDMGKPHEALEVLRPIDHPTATDSFLVARCLSLTGEFAGAATLLESVRGASQARPQTDYYLGCAYAHLGRYSEAAESFGRFLEGNPADVRALVQRGHSYLSSERFDDAAIDYRAAHALAPTDPDVVRALARACVISGDHQEALDLLRPLCDESPDDADLQLLVGHLCERTSAHSDARGHYETALRLRPEWDEARVRLGTLLNHQALDRMAVDYLQQAKRNGDRSPQVLYHLGLSLARIGRCAEALAYWQQLDALPDQLPTTLRELQQRGGAEAVRREDVVAALAAWGPLLDEDPGNDRLRRDVAELYFRIGLRLLTSSPADPKAEEELREAKRLDPEHPFAQWYLALAPLALGLPNAAVERFEVLQADAAKDRSDYHRVLVKLAACPTDADAASTLAAVASSAEIQGYPARWLLALLHAHRGRFEQVLDILQGSPPPGVTTDQVTELIACCLMHLERVPEVESLLAGAEAGGESRQLDYIYGMVHLRRGRISSAIERLRLAGSRGRYVLIPLLEQWIESCVARGQGGSAVEALAVAVEVAPEHEPFTRMVGAMGPQLAALLVREGRREEVIRQLEGAMKRRSSTMGATQTLTLLYLWWAEELESSGKRKAEEAWRGAIRNVVALSCDRVWWEARRIDREKICGRVDAATWKGLQNHFVDHVERRLRELRNEYANKGRSEDQARIDRLSSCLQLERVSAGALHDVTVALASQAGELQVVCGVDMLRHLGLHEAVQSLVTRARAAQPLVDAVDRLRWCLSPWALPWILLEERRFEEAISWLETRADSSDDACDLLARALLEEGRALLPLARAREDGECGASTAERALVLYRCAKGHVRNQTGLIESIHEAVTEMATVTSGQLVAVNQLNALERAASLVSTAFDIAPVPHVQETLAELVAQIGTWIMNYPDEVPPAYTVDVARGYLQEALRLDPQNVRARNFLGFLKYSDARQLMLERDYHGARQAILQAKTMKPDDGQIEWLAKFIFGLKEDQFVYEEEDGYRVMSVRE